VIGVGDPGDVNVGQLAVHPVGQRAEFAGVDEEDLPTAVT
jgi:hypothetical protein